MKDREILCGGNPEPQFRRLEIDPECTYDGFGWYGARLSAWRVTDEQWNRLNADSVSDRDHWSDGSAWWRWAEGASLGGVNADVEWRGRKFMAWDRSDEDDPADLGWYGDLLSYLCDHVGASTEKNVTACCIELARQNGLELGEFLTLALGSGREATR